MSSFDGWGEDEDLDVSATSVGGDGWGDDDDFFGDDGDDEKKNTNIAFPSAVPVVAESNLRVKSSQSNDDKEELNLNDGWGEDNDFFDDDENDDEKGEEGIGFPSAVPEISAPNPMSVPSQSKNGMKKQKVDDGWGDDDDFFEDDGTSEKIKDGSGFPPAAPTIVASNQTRNQLEPKNEKDEHNFDDGWGEDDDFFDDASDENVGDVHIQAEHSAQSVIGSATTSQPRHMPAGNDLNFERNPMVIELSKYIQSLDRILSSINAVLEFEYNTCQKAEELLEYYDKRPQLAEYTRTKEIQRMNYEIVLPDGNVETNIERILAENLLPDNAIVSRAANQSLLADILQVITGHDLIVRPQYLASCIATSCKFVIHKGDHGVDMIDCRSQLSLYLPTADGDRLSIAEVTVSIVFSPSQPMIEFRVVKIDVLLKDFSKLSSVAAFLNEMDVPTEDHEVIDAPPDMYRDAFLEKSQRFFALSSEGMKSAFQQMDSVINLKGKVKSISSFMPGTDQVLAAEQEAIAFAEARRIEQEQQRQRGPSFPRPPPPQASNGFRGQSQHVSQATTDQKRPKSILGGLVRSGWKTLANSVTIPDDDPDIYGQFVPSQAPRDVDPQIKFYRKEENLPAGQNLFRNDDAQNRGQNPQMHFQHHEDSRRELQGANIPESVIESETSGPDSFGLHSANHESSTAPELKSANSGLNDGPVPQNAEHERNNCQPIEKQMEEISPSENVRGLEEEECQEASKHEINDEEIENDFDDGWDEGLDGFDDISDQLEDFPDATQIPPHPDQEVFESASDIVLVEKTVPSCEIKYDEEDDVCDTRRRWINPRPYRPYLKF